MTTPPVETPVEIPKDVLDAITVVRDTGLTNMFDRHTVVRLLREADRHEAVEWVENHPDEYPHVIRGEVEVVA